MARFSIRSMTEADARAIAGWRYPGEYAFYDADADAGDLAELMDAGRWGREYFAVDVHPHGAPDLGPIAPGGRVPRRCTMRP